MPALTMTPTRSAFSGVILSPDMSMAIWLAAIARWMKRSIFLISFGSMYFSGSKPWISPAICVGMALSSNCVMGPMPDLPLIRPSQLVSVSRPTGVIIPMPVTTTLLFKRGYLLHKKSEKPKNLLPLLRERSSGFLEFVPVELFSDCSANACYFAFALI